MLNSKQTQKPVKLSSEDVLEALGLERRHSRGTHVGAAIGLALAGFIVGVGAVLLRAGANSISARKDSGVMP